MSCSCFESLLSRLDKTSFFLWKAHRVWNEMRPSCFESCFLTRNMVIEEEPLRGKANPSVHRYQARRPPLQRTQLRVWWRVRYLCVLHCHAVSVCVCSGSMQNAALILVGMEVRRWRCEKETAEKMKPHQEQREREKWHRYSRLLLTTLSQTWCYFMLAHLHI